MAWPKGQRRKGYVRKDGQAHQKWGQTLAPQIQARIEVLRSRISSTDTGTMASGVKSPGTGLKLTRTRRASTSSGVSPALEGIRSQRRKYTTPLTHPQYSIEQCPNCEFPEADGGYCPDCGWSKPVVYGVAF